VTGNSQAVDVLGPLSQRITALEQSRAEQQEEICRLKAILMAQQAQDSEAGARGIPMDAEWSVVSKQDGPRNMNRGKAVLVDHGSYNPPHLSRVRAMAKAKERLEAEGFEVVAGIMGVAPKSWVHKKGCAALSDENRAALIDIMADECGYQSWLRADLRGAKHKSYYHMIEGDLAAEYPQHTLFGLIDGNYACGRFQQGPCVCVGPTSHHMPREDADLHFAVFDEQCTPINYGQLNKSIYNNEKETLAKLVGERAALVLLDMPANAWEPSPHHRWY